MPHSVVVTFDPDRYRDNSASHIVHALRRNHEFSVDKLTFRSRSELEASQERHKETLAAADVIVHNSFLLYEQARAEVMGIHDEHNAFHAVLNEEISGIAAAGTSIVLSYNANLGDSDARAAGIPTVPKISVDAWKQDPFYPAVFRHKGSWKGKGIFCIDNYDQFERLLDEGYFQRQPRRWRKQASRLDPDDIDVMRMIDTPSDFFTHYRVFTAGNGEILGAVLSYSAQKKNAGETVTGISGILGPDWTQAYFTPRSPFYLGLRKITSNSSTGGRQITLDPTSDARCITQLEEQILEDHGVVDQKLPGDLRGYALAIARLYAPSGGYALGIDFFQERETKMLGEVNLSPGSRIFSTLFNNGRHHEDTARRIGGEKIAEAMYRQLHAA
ncbi:MAG: hypothetical protein OXR66_03720 [Candidatus Woesearchaeota archaeon]|nr:hypothetical protein [Candidatus Woesearchaeota archaeon]